jgi:hypothetical protein
MGAAQGYPFMMRIINDRSDLEHGLSLFRGSARLKDGRVTDVTAQKTRLGHPSGCIGLTKEISRICGATARKSRIFCAV